MDTETEEKLTYMARQIASEICRNPAALMVSNTPAAAAAAAAASSTAFQACGTLTPLNGCENLLYAPITTFRFYRGGRTDINIVQEGQIPVVPGASVLLSQDARPPWPTGCYSLRYRLANNGANHDEIQIEWFLDDELLDTKHYGSEIYNNGRHRDRRRPAAGPAGDGAALLRRRQQPPQGPHPPPRQQQPDREHPPVRPPRQGHQVLLVVLDGPVVRLRRQVLVDVRPGCSPGPRWNERRLSRWTRSDSARGHSTV
jgi:hypothetical protein